MFDRLKKRLAALTFSQGLSMLVWMGLLGYLLAFCYFYYTKGLRAVVWHTHLMFLVYVWLAVFYGLNFLYKKTGVIRFRHGLYVFTLFLASLFVYEVSILLFDFESRDRNQYWAPFESRGAPYYHRWSKNGTHYLNNTEFVYQRTTNSLGFPDKEWKQEKDSNEVRILCLGDSFTEGDGAHMDSSYVAFLRRGLSRHFNNLTIMNAGVCGSDPFYNFVSLRDMLVQYKPDLIIQTISMNDITTDYFVRGGMERFIEKGPPEKVKFRKGPWWEPIYAMNYASRSFFRLAGYNYQLLSKEQEAALMASADSAHIDLFKRYHALAREHEIRVCLVLLPLKEHVDFGNSPTLNYDFTAIRRFVTDSASFEVVDLLPEYNRYVAENNLGKYDVYWVYDGHHNARGYRMMAEEIEKVVLPVLKEL